MHIRALRAIERYGIGTLAQAFRGYVALAPTEYDWRLVLGVKETATLADVEAAFLVLAKQHHPDAGGRHDDMTRLTAARDRARVELAR